MPYQILVSDNLSEKGVALLQESPEISVDVHTSLKADELRAIIGNYDALIVRSATKVTEDVINAGKKLKIVGRAGIGVDNIDVSAATKKGIVVVNAPGGNTVTTAEHALSLLLALCRKIPQATASMKAGKWEKNRFVGTEIFNKTLGIIGLGNIGKIVADRAQGLGMKVIAYDPFLAQEVAEKLGVEVVSLESLYSRSDFITIHTPLNDQTRYIINRNAFDLMKPGVKVVNCARGGLIDEEALFHALTSGKVSGAALDVFENEPPPANHPLLTQESVICTPHLGASTEEAQDQVAVSIAQSIRAYFLDNTIENAVNVPAVSGTTLARLQPYLLLVERMGSFLMQLCKKIPEEVTIEYAGEILDFNVLPLTAAFLRGFMRPMDEGVNFINAPMLAKERGIRIREIQKSQSMDFLSEISVQIQTDCEVNEISGTVFGKGDPRIIRIGKFRVEAAIEGQMLITRNKDVPGVIGRIGTLLGENRINIAGFQLGRNQVGGEALAVINIDNALPKSVLDQILKLPTMLSATVVTL